MVKKVRTRRSSAITKDLPLKLMAVGGAILLWLGVTLLGSHTVTITDVPVSAVNIPSDLGLSSELSTVDVRVKVPRTRTIDQDIHQLLRAIVDLEGSGIGERNVPVNVISTDSTLSIVSVTPSSLRVALDPVVERELPVRVVTDGEPAEGYRVGEATLSVDQVRVTGALGMFQDISSIDVPISVEGADKNIETEAQLTLPAAVRIAPDSVKVNIEIEEAEMTKTVGVEAQVSGTPSAGYFVRSVAITPQVVQVRGAREDVEELLSIKTKAISVDNLSQTIEETAELDLPEGVVRTEEDTIQVNIEIAPLEGTKEVQASISVIDVEDDLEVASVSPASIRVTLRGNSADLDRVRDGDVTVALSVEGKNEGELRITPTEDDVRVSGEVVAVAIENREIVITLSEV